MRKNFLLMLFLFALLGTAGAQTTQVTYSVTKSAGTWFWPDGTAANGDNWFASKFVSSDDVLTLESNYQGINSNFTTDKGFRINQGGSNLDVVSYTLSVSAGYTIVRYTFGAAPNGGNNNSIEISLNETMENATTIQKTGENKSYTQDVNASQSTFYLRGKTAIDVTLTVVVEAEPGQLVRDYLTADKINNVNCAGQYGYPKEETESYKNIKSLVDKLTQEDAVWTNEDYANVAPYYEAYLAETDIVIPETGKFYRIYASVGNNKKFLLASGEKIIGRRTTEEALSNEASSIWYLDKDYKLTAFSSGYQYAGTAGGFNVMGYEGGTKVEFIRCPAAFGKVSIRSKNLSNNTQWFIQASAAGDNDLTTTPDASLAGAQFYVGEVNALPITISEAGFATFYSPVAVTVPEGVTAYTGAISENGAALNLTSVEEIPANTAVILEKKGGGDVNLPIIAEAASVAEAENEVFTGTISAIATPEGARILTLQNRDGDTGFYPYGGTTLVGFKAYLELDATSGVKSLSLNFGQQATGIETSVVGITDTDAAVYDLSGRRVEKAVKGIYIVNGKKTVIK